MSYISNLLTKLYLKTSGWKAILGYLVTKAVGLLPGEAPTQEFEVVLTYLGELLLAYGLLDRARKNIKGE